MDLESLSENTLKRYLHLLRLMHLESLDENPDRSEFLAVYLIVIPTDLLS